MNLSMEIYTDGSVLNDRSAGYGIYAPNPEYRESIHTFESNNIFYVESMAILRAVTIAAAERPNKVGIFSDSFSTVNALNSPDLDAWIPGYKNIPGNEMADRLAGLEARSSEYPLEQLSPPWIGDFIDDFKNTIKQEANDFIEKEFTHKGIKYRANTSELASKPWFKDLGIIDRNVITLMARLLPHMHNEASKEETQHNRHLSMWMA
ncbi:uncharacterized protein LOC112590434 [Harpegnathos saltator]|uniref:uncharacterized protein LOC112590434 n=1 Tax=Harpegnathos saltator TaxID=610380 RepID=UPI000DBEE8A8|nr:uncharacterized protein LOC112590434 [Harpegnathos saltator]